MITEPPPPPEALTQYLAFILEPMHADLVPVDAATEILGPLGIEWRLVCRVRMVTPEGLLLTLTTSDASPVLAVHSKTWRPAEASTLENRRQVGVDTWEYDTVRATERVPLGELALRLSRSQRTLSVPLAPVIPTLVHRVGWGRPIDNVEVEAAVDSAALAWAVTELLTGLQAPSAEIHNSYERFRSAHALVECIEREAKT